MLPERFYLYICIRNFINSGFVIVSYFRSINKGTREQNEKSKSNETTQNEDFFHDISPTFTLLISCASLMRCLYSLISNIIAIKIITTSFKGNASHHPRTFPLSKRGNISTKGTTSASCLSITNTPACFALPIA